MKSTSLTFSLFSSFWQFLPLLRVFTPESDGHLFLKQQEEGSSRVSSSAIARKGKRFSCGVCHLSCFGASFLFLEFSSDWITFQILVTESETLKSWELSESVCYIRLWDILSLHSVVLKTIWICYCSLGCWFGPLISTVNSWSNSSIYDTQLIVAIKLLYYH